MTYGNKNSITSKALVVLFLLITGTFLFEVPSAEALDGSFLCSRHGFHEKELCPSYGWSTVTDFGGRFNNYTTTIDFWGHRHGSSGIRSLACLVTYSGDEGPCKRFSGRENELGPEYGDSHPFQSYPGIWGGSGGGGTISVTNTSDGYLLMVGSYVEDAEIKTIWKNTRAWNDEEKLICTDSGAINYGGLWPCEYDTPRLCTDSGAINYGGLWPCKYVEQPRLSCSPANQTVGVNQPAGFSAGGGAGGYSWNANDGNPSSGTGSSFSTKYPKPDSGKTVRLTDVAGGYSECYVKIEGGGDVGGGSCGSPDEYGSCASSEERKRFLRDNPGDEGRLKDVFPCKCDGGGGGDGRVEICGDGRVGAGEECDLGGGNGACPSDCSASCRRNTCGSCELPRSPYFSENEEDLIKHAQRLEIGTCYRLGSPVDGRCFEPQGPTRQGSWSARESDNKCERSDSCVSVCNQDNSCPGCYLGEYTDSARATCERRYSCSVDNGVPITVDMRCGSSSNGPCEINLGQSTTVSWTVTTRYGCGSDGNCWNDPQQRSQYETTCTASGDWSGTKVNKLPGGDRVTESKIATTAGSESTGALNSTRTYTYTLNCSNSFSVARDTVNVIVTGSIPDNPSTVNVTEPNYCASGPAATTSWTYSDPSGSPQSAYQVQIDDQGSFQSPERDSGKVNSGSTSYFTGQGYLQFNTTYKARVRVWNSYDQVSGWSESGSFKTPNFAYPQVNFTWTQSGFSEPVSPQLNKLIQFTDQTVFGGNPVQREWGWLFGDRTSSTQQNPTKTYVSEGTYYVTLTAEDSQGQACSKTRGPLWIQKPIPVWKEVAPR